MSVAAALAPAAGASSVILNEYNAVSSGNHLDEENFADSSKADTRLGRIQGNGLNWFELAVVGDGTAGSAVDMRGWELRWAETDKDEAEKADGNDIWFGDGDVEQGIITLTNDAFWANVPAGTLITFGQEQTLTAQSGATVVNGSDTGLDFAVGDNWAHIYTFDTQYVTTQTNVTDDNPGDFSVGNDDWQITILDASDTAVFGPVGEGIPSSTGLNSREVFKLETDISTAITETTSGDGTGYADGTSSSFGAPNTWSGGDFSQDFTSFGVVPEPATLGLLAVGGVLLAGRGCRRG